MDRAANITGPADILAPEAGHPTPGERTRASRSWRRPFLETLAETSCVKTARLRVLISETHIYRLRRTDPDFADQWLIALAEGYDHLEMEMLGRLRAGERRDAEIKYDNGAAMRLLAQHRANAERGRALRAHEDEQSVLDSIDALFRDMRERRAANAALLAEGEDAHGRG